MRYFLLKYDDLLQFLYVSDMFPLKPDENYTRRYCINATRGVSLLNARFGISSGLKSTRRANFGLFCGLLKDTDGQYIKDEDDKYYLFDRILPDSVPKGG